MDFDSVRACVLRVVCVFGSCDIHTDAADSPDDSCTKTCIQLNFLLWYYQQLSSPLFEHTCGLVFTTFHLQEETGKHTQTQISKLTQVDKRQPAAADFRGLGAASQRCIIL